MIHSKEQHIQDDEPTQQRPYHQDKHQFPLSSYDPRQYGFNNNYSQKRNDINNRSNINQQSMNNNNTEVDIDLIEEWWEDNNTELTTGTDPSNKTTTLLMIVEIVHYRQA